MTSLQRCNTITGAACDNVTTRLEAADILAAEGRQDLAEQTRRTAHDRAWRCGMTEKPAP